MSMTMPLIPRVSEKSYGLSEKQGVFVFEVPLGANKHSVAKAVTAQFGVTVTHVNILNAKGKTKRTILKRSRPIQGRNSDIKKAYVTVKEGESIPVFQAEETATKPKAKKGAK